MKTKQEGLSDEAVDPKVGVSRRNFIKLTTMGAAGGAVALTLPKARADDDDDDHRRHYSRDPEYIDPVPKWLSWPWWSERRFWKKVQREFTLDPKRVYMNIGTTGSMPKRVLYNFDAYNRLVAKYPWERRVPGSDVWASTTAMRQAIAPGYGCDYQELWMSENTTNGLAQIFNGLPFEADDVILTTIHEHPAGTNPMRKLQDRFGVKIKYLTIPTYDATGKQDFVDVFEQGIEDVKSETGAFPRLIFFTQTTYKTGTTLPAKEICDLARYYGITTVIDGAHNTGMLNLNFNDIGCDFYSGSGHKWQCGPGRTGIAYVRNQGGDLPVIWVPEGSYRAGSQNRSEGDNIAGLMQSHGNPHYPSYRCLHDACMFWDAIGRQRIEDYILDLSAYTKKKIRKYFDDSDPELFWCPSARELSSGLTTFNPFENKESRDLVFEFRERLREEYGYIIRYTNFYKTAEDMANGVPQTYAMRISTHLFHDFDQIDGLMEAMADLYDRMVNGEPPKPPKPKKDDDDDDDDDD